VALVVKKSIQTPLAVSGIPDTIIYGDTPFYLSVGGGSGLGSLNQPHTYLQILTNRISLYVTIQA